MAEDTNGVIWHGRNLDWNLDPILRQFIIDINFVNGSSHLFTGTGIVGYMGLINAIRPGSNGWSFSLDARCQGGKLLGNIVEGLFHGGMTPGHHARMVMETAMSFQAAVDGYASGALIDEIYYIVGGTRRGEGCIVSRDRDPAITDSWYLNDTEADGDGWFRLETNYDHWNAPPSSDDRRNPGVAAMRKLGRAGLDENSLFTSVMRQWPVFNPHTDFTGIFSAATGLYKTMYWSGE